MKALRRSFFCSNFKEYEILAKAFNFRLAYLRRDLTWGSNISLLSLGPSMIGSTLGSLAIGSSLIRSFLGSSLIGSPLSSSLMESSRSSVIGSSLGSSFIGSSLASWVLGFSVEASVLVFQYAWWKFKGQQKRTYNFNEYILEVQLRDFLLNSKGKKINR